MQSLSIQRSLSIPPYLSLFELSLTMFAWIFTAISPPLALCLRSQIGYSQSYYWSWFALLVLKLTTTQNQTIINFRNQELLARNGSYLAQLAQGQLVESRSATIASDKTNKDSRTVRIATLVAMFYLPATLVLVFIHIVLNGALANTTPYEVLL